MQLYSKALCSHGKVYKINVNCFIPFWEWIVLSVKRFKSKHNAPGISTPGFVGRFWSSYASFTGFIYKSTWHTGVHGRCIPRQPLLLGNICFLYGENAFVALGFHFDSPVNVLIAWIVKMQIERGLRVVGTYGGINLTKRSSGMFRNRWTDPTDVLSGTSQRTKTLLMSQYRFLVVANFLSHNITYQLSCLCLLLKNIVHRSYFSELHPRFRSTANLQREFQ